MSGRDREQTPGPGADDRGPQEAAAAPGPDASPKTPFLKRISALFSGPQPAANLADAIENGGDHAVAALPQGRREMIERVIAFDEKRVVDVMAPRADIIAIDVSTPMDELLKAFAEAGHSRLPVYRGDLDDPIGMAHIKDVVALLADPAAPGDSESNCNADNDVDAGGESDSDSAEPILRRIKRDVLYAPPSMPITDLLLRMQASRIHMALVIDEFGGTDGLVTTYNPALDLPGFAFFPGTANLQLLV
ncbi:MAG: CBS domain-containing protein, partial [Pseudomonadota bacterium]